MCKQARVKWTRGLRSTVRLLYRIICRAKTCSTSSPWFIIIIIIYLFYQRRWLSWLNTLPSSTTVSTALRSRSHRIIEKLGPPLLNKRSHHMSHSRWQPFLLFFFFFFLPILCCLARRGRDPYLLHAGVKIGLKSQSYFNFWRPTSSSMHVQRTKKTLDNPKEV